VPGNEPPRPPAPDEEEAELDEETDRLLDLIEFIARGLVEKKDAVEVEDVEEDDSHVIELTVAEDDLGKVIGKQGRTARAIRTVLSAAASKTGRRVSLEILE
jgi:predicted RNA-binding protein YlqC (UPF0109 family)